MSLLLIKRNFIMKIIIRNLSNEAVLKILKSDGNKTEIPPKNEACFLAYDHEFLFSAHYIKEFSFFNKTSEFSSASIKEKIADRASDMICSSIDKAVLQIENEFKIICAEKDVTVEVCDKCYYVKTNEKDRFFHCLPVVCYLPFAKCEEDNIELISSFARNREDFISFYKKIFILINLKNIFFGFFRYFFQVSHHKRISKSKKLTDIFSKIFMLHHKDRESEFKASNAISSQIYDILQEKLPEFVLKRFLKKTKQFLMN